MAFSFGKMNDPDATLFIQVSEITGSTQRGAIVDLVKDLKSNGLWSKMKAIYPFVGGTATTHRFNLKDPRDVNAAFRLTFSGGWTHSSNGIDPNGSNAYADTFLVPSTQLTYTDSHGSVYIREDVSGAIRQIEYGSYVGSPNRLFGIYSRYLNNTDADIGDFNTSRITVSNTDSRGYYIVRRNSNSNLRLYKNGTTAGTNTNNDTSGLPTNSIYLSAVVVTGTIQQYSPRQIAFATFGQAITDTDATNLYNIVQRFQTSLGRQV
jgi:hypothetical protein